MPATASVVPATQLDRDNPWPGLESFAEDARDYFHGREAEAEELLRRVADAPLTVLFGKSGLGKTSLLKAGLFPRLREEYFLPVHMRLDLRPEAPDLVEQLRDGLRAEIARERVDAPPFAAGETLWEYLHRADLELWSEQNHLLTPVLVLDQFEEVFTLGERFPETVEHCKIDLGDLAENRIPEALAGRLADDASAAQRLDLRRMAYKLVVTLREDFLPHLEGWRAAVPSLGRVRVRLLPMRPEQALSAVYDTAPHLMDEPLARRIVAFVAAAQEPSDGDGEIEPALLSLFCRGLNEQRKRLGKDRFDEQLLEGAQQSIIADYYRSCVEGMPDSVSRFIESDLITEKGFRNSYAKDDAVPGLLTQEQLDRLINRRLLRLEERYGTVRIELTHDLLTRAVMAHRDQRRVEEERQALAAQARRQRRRVLAMAVVALVCLAFAGIAAWQALKAFSARQDSLSAKLAVDSRVERDRDLSLSCLLAAGAWSVQRTPEARSALLSCLAFSPNGKTLAVGTEGNTVMFLDGVGRTVLGEPLVGNADRVLNVAFSPDGKILAAGNGFQAVALWDVALRRPLDKPLAGNMDSVLSVAFSPDGKILALGSMDGTVNLWDVGRRTPVGKPLVGHEGTVRSMAFSPDGKTLASGNENGTVSLWDFSSGKVIGKLVRYKDPVLSVAFSPGGRTLASGSLDHNLILWDVSRGRAIWDFTSRPHPGKPLAREISVLSVAFSPDGETLASGGVDGTVALWDVASHASLGEPLAGHGKGKLVEGVAFSPDGETLASAADDIILWDVARRTRLGEKLVGNQTQLTSVSFSPDSKILASGSKAGQIILWDLDPDSWSGRACSIASRNLTCDEWRRYLRDEFYRKLCPDFPGPESCDEP